MTKNTFKFGELKIEASAIGSQGNAVLGIRDSGKTYTATLLAEKMFDAGIPFVAFDPIGVWRGLRIPGEGKGYPVVVAGGKDGDLPLTVAGAPEIVRAAMRGGVSLVIDLFDMALSKNDWKRIVTICVRVLLHENTAYGMRHIFIEEAAEFAPQRPGPDQTVVYAEIEKLARMGRNSGLGYTIINQRAEEVSKAVLELCDNLFLHRQKGKNSLNSLAKWLDIGNAQGAKEIISSLSTLPQGECWAWMEGSDTPVRVKVPAKNSMHPDARAMRGQVKSGVKVKEGVDVKSFVSKMKSSLTTIEAEADANDPVKLRKRIAELEKAIKAGKPAPAAGPDLKALARAQQEGHVAGFSSGYDEGVGAATKAFEAKQKVLIDTIARAASFANDLMTGKVKPLKKSQITPARVQPIYVAKSPVKAGDVVTFAPARKNSGPATLDGLTGPEQKIIESLIFWKSRGYDAPSKAQVGGIAGYKSNGSTLRGIFSRLSAYGFVIYPTTGQVSLTDAAPKLAAPSDEEARRLLFSVLGGPHQKVLEAMSEDRIYDKAEVAEATGYEAEGSTLRGIFSFLSTLEIVEYPQRGTVQVKPWAKEVLS